MSHTDGGIKLKNKYRWNVTTKGSQNTHLKEGKRGEKEKRARAREPHTWIRKLKTTSIERAKRGKYLSFNTTSIERARRGKYLSFNVHLSKHDVWVLNFMLHLQHECLPWTSMLHCICCIYVFKCLAHVVGQVLNNLLPSWWHNQKPPSPSTKSSRPHLPTPILPPSFFHPKKKRQKSKYIILSTTNHHK